MLMMTKVIDPDFLGGAPTYFFVFLAKNCMKIKSFGPRGQPPDQPMHLGQQYH